MQQKNEKIYPEVITMEEYLVKRRKMKENEQNKRKGLIVKETPVWMFTQPFV